MSSPTGIRTCTFCDGWDLLPLPLPHPTQSMLSDGRIWPAPLAKSLCHGCGAVAHATPPDTKAVRRYYDAGYDLGAAPGAQDTDRNRTYADFILARAGRVPPARVLEIGCGSGHTLAGLARAWPRARFLGLEAAAQLAARPGSERVEIVQGFAEDLAPPDRPYDLVFAINVVEHAADPRAFVAAAARQLAPGGRILLVCPAPEPPNLELVFQDHVHSFARAAFTRVAATAGLEIIEAATDPGGLAGLQAFTLVRGGVTRPDTAEPDPGRADRLVAYLSAWQRLDGVLADRTGGAGTVDLFGAGEMAALLRCYAPRLWGRVRHLLVDDLSGARALGREVRSLNGTRPGEATDSATVIATHPRSQSSLAARLREAGHRPVVFNDLIAR